MVKYKAWNQDHLCGIASGPDELEIFYPGTSRAVRFKRWLRRQTLVSQSNPLAQLILRSHAAVTAERFRHMRSHPIIIHPFSRFRSMWEIFMVFVLFVSMMMIPILTAFKEYWNEFIFMVDVMLDTLCMLDIFVNFLSGYYDMNTKEIYLKPNMIAMHYLKGYFVMDFLSSFPLDKILEGTRSEKIELSKVIYAVNLLNILKLFRMKSLMKYYKQFALVVDMEEVTLLITRFIMISLIFIQWISCGHYLVASLIQTRFTKEPSPDSWIVQTGILNQTMLTKYRYSLFRGMSSSFKIDYAFVRPKTIEDVVYTVIAQMGGLAFIVYFIALVYQLMSVMDASRDKYNEMVQQLKEFMKHKRLPANLQKRLVDYYEFRFQKKYFREWEILNTLGGQLRQEIVLHSCRRLVENVEFFNNLPIQVLMRIVTCLRSEIYLTNDVIVKAGSPGDSMYFIASGTVAVYTAAGQEVAHLEDGSHFGEIALIMEEECRVASVVAVERCVLYKLNRNDFRLAVAPYPNLVDRIESIAEARLQDTQDIVKRKMQSMSTTIDSMTQVAYTR